MLEDPDLAPRRTNKEKCHGSASAVAGVTGLAGSNLAKRLVSNGWEVLGIARNPHSTVGGVRPIAADMLEPAALRVALAGVEPTHVFFTTWVRRATEEENIAANAALVRNVLGALDANKSLRHVALVTGLKHYLGSFEDYATAKVETPLREDLPRLPTPNFYYAQEDELFEAARRQGFTWSVHRAHTTIGYSLGTLMNMGVTLAVYAAICHESHRPFVFPGSAVQWNGLTDVTDARVLAKQLEWAATSEAGRNEAFNIVNGDIFRWRWLWPKLAADFRLEAAPYPARRMPLEQQLVDAGPIWTKVAARHGLVEPDLGKLASPWHTDLDLGREIEVVTDMTKSRLAGFHEYQATLDSFSDLFARLRRERIIPA